MLRKMISALLLLVGLASLGGCLKPTGRPGATPVSMSVPASMPTVVNVALPTLVSLPEATDTSLPTATTPGPTGKHNPRPNTRALQATVTDTPLPATATPNPTATDTPAPALPPAPIPGHPAPDFTLPDLEGNQVRLSDFKGQAVLINFWTTW